MVLSAWVEEFTASRVTLRAELTCEEISRIDAVSCSEAEATVCALANA
jgi:hypothetical protein